MSCDWLFVDGSSLIFRAFHGVPSSVVAPDGHQVNAVRGFLETLTRLLHSRRPRHLAVASDEDWRPAWRVALIPEYKAHRVAEPVPPALEPQMDIINQVLTAVGVEMIGTPGYEAEDVISSWTAAAPGTVEVVSGDRDLFALVEDPRVIILYPEKGGMAVVTEAEVTRRYGIPGRRYAEYAVLRGDPSDGLPGLRGVGAVTAATMINRHPDLDALAEGSRLTDAQRDYLRRALRVVQPVTNLPLPLPDGRRDTYPADDILLAELARRHGVENTVVRLVQALSSMAQTGG